MSVEELLKKIESLTEGGKIVVLGNLTITIQVNENGDNLAGNKYCEPGFRSR